MKLLAQHLRLAATDLSNHLACHHLTALQLSVARGKREAPKWQAPDLKVIQELGDRHEQRYLELLQREGLSFVNLARGEKRAAAIEQTVAAMERGLDVIAQGALSNGRWFGRPDVLRKVTTGSKPLWSLVVRGLRLQTNSRDQSRNHPATRALLGTVGAYPGQKTGVHARCSRRGRIQAGVLPMR